MDSKKCSLLLLLDNSAAYDTVNHTILEKKLLNMGIEGKPLSMVKSFIGGRKFKVVIDKISSTERTLLTGIPQGSILSPLLYSLYTASIATVLDRMNVQYHMYADDLQLYIQITNIEDTIEQVINILNTMKGLMTDMHLKLNDGKTKILLIGSKVRTSKLQLQLLKWDDLEIQFSKSCKNLGVILDSHLTLTDQVKDVVRVINFYLYEFRNIRNKINQQSAEKLVSNFILSKLDYCNILYNNLPNKLLDRLQIAQNNAARFLSNTRPRERITPALIQRHWLPIKARVKFKINLITYQFLLYDEPSYFKDLISKREIKSSIRIRALDDPHRLTRTRVASKWGARSFFYTAPIEFNLLPVQVKSSATVTTFKKRLKTFLFNWSYDLSTQTIRADARTH